jgi:hypothetical protein
MRWSMEVEVSIEMDNYNNNKLFAYTTQKLNLHATFHC